MWVSNRGLRSCVIFSAAPFSSRGGLLMLFPCSSVVSLSWETVLHKMVPHNPLPQGVVLQKQDAPAWVPHRVINPASRPAPLWIPLSMIPQIPTRSLPSVGFPQSHSTLWAHLPVPVWDPSGLQGNLCSGTRSTSFPSFVTDLSVL